MAPVYIKTQNTQSSTQQMIDEFRADQIAKARQAADTQMENQKAAARETASVVVRLSKQATMANSPMGNSMGGASSHSHR
jgi:hypothetical protein